MKKTNSKIAKLKSNAKKLQKFVASYKRKGQIEESFNKMINLSQAVAILGDKILREDPNNQLAQYALWLVDELDKVYEWVSTGRPLPSQVREVEPETIDVAPENYKVHSLNKALQNIAKKAQNLVALTYLAKVYKAQIIEDDDSEAFPGKYKVKIYKETITWPEDPEDENYEEETEEEFEETYESLEELLNAVAGKSFWVEWSGSPHMPGDWIIGESQQDNYTGAYETLSMFIKHENGDDLNEAETEYVHKMLGLHG